VGNHSDFGSGFLFNLIVAKNSVFRSNASVLHPSMEQFKTFENRNLWMIRYLPRTRICDTTIVTW